MEERVQEHVASLLGITTNTLLQSYDDKELWNSLQFVELVFSVEDEFNVRFSEEELSAIPTPRLLIESIIKKVE